MIRNSEKAECTTKNWNPDDPTDNGVFLFTATKQEEFDRRCELISTVSTESEVVAKYRCHQETNWWDETQHLSVITVDNKRVLRQVVTFSNMAEEGSHPNEFNPKQLPEEWRGVVTNIYQECSAAK
jgi:hypothetical protein